MKSGCGTVSCINPRGATYSNAGGIGWDGTIVGFYVDSAKVAHGYIREPCR